MAKHRTKKRTTTTSPKRPHTTQIVAGGNADLPLPAAGFIRFRAVNHDELGLVVELDGPVTPTGYGTYEVVDRQGRVGLTAYKGRQPLALKIPLLFDDWERQGSVEDEVRMLERLHALEADIAQPPAMIVEGFGVPHSYSRAPLLRYVFTGDPEWGDDIRTRGTDGHRSFVPVTVTAMQLVLPTTVKKAQGPPVEFGRRRFYTVPAHGGLRTLHAIARHRHMDWHTLRNLNPKLSGDPDHKLRSGTKVRVA